MEENDVFYSATENVGTIVGKTLMENGSRRVQALSDSSNSLKKAKSGLGLGGNSFGFKKPTPLTSTKSREEMVIKKDTPSKLVRANSVPTSLGKPPISTVSSPFGEKEKSTGMEETRNKFYDFYDELYPEPEFLRDISLQDLKEYVITSPIDIGLDEMDNFGTINDNNSIVEEDEGIDNDGLSDEQYPEIEKLPASYATQVLMDDPVWIRDMSVSYEKDDPAISELPSLEYDVESHFSFITDYLSSVKLSLESFDIPENFEEEDSFDGTVTIR